MKSFLGNMLHSTSCKHLGEIPVSQLLIVLTHMTEPAIGWKISLVPIPCGEKQSGEQSLISWAYSPKRWKTNETARLLITTSHFPYNVYLHSSIHTFFEQVFRKIIWTLLGYTVAKAPASPRNLTWFTRPLLLLRGWGLGTRLLKHVLWLCTTYSLTAFIHRDVVRWLLKCVPIVNNGVIRWL